MSRSRLSGTLVRAFRWRDWALAIESANELEAAGLSPERVVPFVDTSEVVEYVLPNSLLANDFPTRLDLSLEFLFARQGGLFALGPHAREINGIRHSWEQRTRLVKQELKMLRERYDEPETVNKVRAELRVLAESGARDRATDLVRLIRDNHKWLYSAWRVPLESLPAFFDRLRQRLRVTSRSDLGVTESWSYEPDSESVNAWLQRLDNTTAGHGEPAPNLIDAYSLDQVEQIALAQDRSQSKQLAILYSHSGKILEAIRKGRERREDLMRVRGVSLVQPPQVALVWRLREEARKAGNLSEVTEELERQRERGERIGSRIDEVTKGKVNEQENHDRDDGPADGSTFEGRLSDLRRELDELDKISAQWAALQSIRRTLDPAVERRRRGILEELREILEQSQDDKRLRDSLERELEVLIRTMDRLQGQISNRLLPPRPPTDDLELNTGGEEIRVFLRSSPSALDQPRHSSASVPSAAYPSGSFRFRDPTISVYLTKMASALDQLKRRQYTKPSEGRQLMTQIWSALHEVEDLRSNLEFYLLMAVIYLQNESWFQAYDMASEGIDMALLDEQPGDKKIDQTAALAELLLARAASARAFVHASRVDVPSVCRAFLERAIDNCFTSLNLQRDGWRQRNDLFPDQGLDPRCLRELAVIVGSAREPAYGPRKPYRALGLEIRWSHLTEWILPGIPSDPLELFEALARQAYKLGKDDKRSSPFYINTYLYALTELDWRDLKDGRLDSRASEREFLAARLTESIGDPNFVDTLMWHRRVLAEGLRRRGEPWEELQNRAAELAASINQRKLGSNRYYQRLISTHQRMI